MIRDTLGLCALIVTLWASLALAYGLTP